MELTNSMLNRLNSYEEDATKRLKSVEQKYVETMDDINKIRRFALSVMAIDADCISTINNGYTKAYVTDCEIADEKCTIIVMEATHPAYVATILSYKKDVIFSTTINCAIGGPLGLIETTIFEYAKWTFGLPQHLMP